MFTLVHLYGHFIHFLVCLGILTCFQSPQPASSWPPTSQHFRVFLLSLMVTCHYWTDNVLFSGLFRLNIPKHTANNANTFLQTQREEWIGHILGGHLLGREFSWRVWILNLCPCVADSCQLGWSVYPECLRGILFLVSSAWPWTAFFSCPHLTDCLQNVLHAFLPYQSRYPN